MVCGLRLKAEASRERWKAAYSELPPGANPKLAELQERDLADSEAREALPDADNSQLKETSQKRRKLTNGETSQKKRTKLTNGETSKEKRLKLTNEMHLQRCTMQIFVKINCSIFRKNRKTHCLKTITLEVMRSNTIYDVKEKIQDKDGIPAVQQTLMFGSELLVDSCSLEDYNIEEESTLTLDLVPQGMHIFIRARSGKIMTIGVEGEDSLYSVKAKFFDETGIPPGRQRLFFAGKQLEDGRTLSDYDVQNESTFHVAFRGITRRSGQMRISVRTVTGKKVIERAMKRRQAVDNIKAWIYSELCILPEEQQLSGEDGAPLAEVIRRSCIVVLQIRPPGESLNNIDAEENWITTTFACLMHQIIQGEHVVQGSDSKNTMYGSTMFDFVSNASISMQLKETVSHVELTQNDSAHEDIARDFRAEINKLKEVEAAKATEAAQTLQQSIDELQVVDREKDDEIDRLRAEAVDAENKETSPKKSQKRRRNTSELQLEQCTVHDPLSVSSLAFSTVSLKITPATIVHVCSGCRYSSSRSPATAEAAAAAAVACRGCG
ncbi:uncharacterized protein LOC119304385 [Triticum dicoccoides]|uniref:uncharacterized protein LOC119304385 n=1 Tax=Triticum dicoccoides TaxID=85692 RepID=UPI00188F5239|nr:uncharacterized protein LOC119304385 [Triticum dicoccoides]